MIVLPALQEEEENELAKALRAIRVAEEKEAALQNGEEPSPPPQQADALSGTTASPTAGVFGRRGAGLRTTPPTAVGTGTGTIALGNIV
jgi:hypothetical protein